MQTPKTRTVSLEVPQKASPTNSRTARQLNIPGADSNSIPSPARRTPKNKSAKIVGRRSPNGQSSEQKKRPGRTSDLESQLAQLQDELKKAKDQLSLSETWKKRAQQDNEEAKKQLAAMSAKLEESQQQLLEISALDDARVQELRKISHDRDRAWESELEAVQKHHSMDSAALASALNEIQKLKMQLEQVAASEAANAKHAELSNAEVQSLRMDLHKAFTSVENLKCQLNVCKESEAQALELVLKTEIQLAMAKSTEQQLKLEGLKAMEAYKSMADELAQSKNQATLLEGLVRKLQPDIDNESCKNVTDPSEYFKIAQQNEEENESIQVKAELNHVKAEVGQLRSELEAAERRYQEEYIQSTLQIRSAYELVECTKLESCKREAELQANLKMAKADVDELKSRLAEMESRFQAISDENQDLNMKGMENQSAVRESELEIELKKFEEDSAEVKERLLEKERELLSVTGENEMLKSEMEKREVEENKVNDETMALTKAARAAEQEALMKLCYLTEEADKSSRKAARVIEQLDAAQAANSQMEAELRRLKVQADQWRKAAEAATAMLSTGSNGNIVERTGSFDNSYYTIGGKLSSPYPDDSDDESPKKKHGNMLKKIGVLLKKGQK